MDKNNLTNTAVNTSLTELCFTANTANSTVELCKYGSPSIANTAYSRDGITWTTFTPSTTQGTNVVTLTNVGDKVYFRNDIIGNFSGSIYLHFSMSGSISASGNVNSIYSSTGFNNLTTLAYSYCYYRLFVSCKSLIAAPALPATTLASHSYDCMFIGCTNLITPPTLPATTLADSCYECMFYRCTALTTPPVLPATTLAAWCYCQMFQECTSLIKPPKLPITTLTSGCYSSMFEYCTSLITPPELPATTLENFCYRCMFLGCTSLESVPALVSTQLKTDCYQYMFSNCTSLQVSDTQTADAPYTWIIPDDNKFTNTSTQEYMFTNCLGTRASNNLVEQAGAVCTYYTQNPPVRSPINYVQVIDKLYRLNADQAKISDFAFNSVWSKKANSTACETAAPTADNPDGLKFVVLSSEPETKYKGWLYIITEP